jgi:hypothetical protein
MKINSKTMTAERSIGNIVPKPNFDWGIPKEYSKSINKRKANRQAKKTRKLNRKK